MSGITTHMLNIPAGRPFVGVKVELYDVSTLNPTLVSSLNTNTDGRAVMLPKEVARTGEFELRFHVGEHFKNVKDALTDLVVVRFAIFDAKQHYHVPMLCSPWFFSTYRGA